MTPQEQYEKETGESAIDSSTGHRHRTQEYAEWLERRLKESPEPLSNKCFKCGHQVAHVCISCGQDQQIE